MRRLCAAVFGPPLRLYARADRFLVLNLPIVWRSRLLLASVLAALNLAAAWLFSRMVPDHAVDVWADNEIDWFYEKYACVTLVLAAIWIVRQMRTPVGDLRIRDHLVLAALNVAAITLLLAGSMLLGACATERTAGVVSRAAFAEDLRYFNAWFCTFDTPTQRIVDELPSLRRHLAVYGLDVKNDVGAPPAALAFNGDREPLKCQPEAATTPRIQVIDATGDTGYNRLASALETIDHQQGLRERDLAWTQHAQWRTAATAVAVFVLAGAALFKPRRRQGSLGALLLPFRRFSLQPSPLLGRLDRAILLADPWLWLFRPHVLLLEFVGWLGAVLLAFAVTSYLSDSPDPPGWGVSSIAIGSFGLYSVWQCMRRVTQFRTPLLRTRHWIRMAIVGTAVGIVGVLVAVGVIAAIGGGGADVDGWALVEFLAIAATAFAIVGMAMAALCNAFDARTAILFALVPTLAAVVLLNSLVSLALLGVLWISPMVVFRFTPSFRDPRVRPGRAMQLWARLTVSTGLVAVVLLGSILEGAREKYVPGVSLLAVVAVAVAVHLCLIRPALDVFAQVACRPAP